MAVIILLPPDFFAAHTHPDLSGGCFIPGLFSELMFTVLLLKIRGHTKERFQSNQFRSAIENATLTSSLTFTVPPAIFTGVIPNPLCFSTAVP